MSLGKLNQALKNIESKFHINFAEQIIKLYVSVLFLNFCFGCVIFENLYKCTTTSVSWINNFCSLASNKSLENIPSQVHGPEKNWILSHWETTICLTSYNMTFHILRKRTQERLSWNKYFSASLSQVTLGTMQTLQILLR